MLRARLSNPLVTLVCSSALLASLLSGISAAAEGADPPPQRDAGQGAEDPTSARDDLEHLPDDWRRSGDVVWTVRGDSTGAHLLAARQDQAYAWSTVATLNEPGVETDRWIANACLTESGRHAVVVYAPRAFTNDAGAFNRGGFTAVVEMSTGRVVKLPLRGTLAYFDPGCGAGETAVITQHRSPEDSKLPAATRLFEVDAATGRFAKKAELQGQLTSAVPTRSGIVAAAGPRVVSIANGQQHVVASASTTPAFLTADDEGNVLFLTGTREHNAILRVPTDGRQARQAVVAESEGTWLGLSRGTNGRTFVHGPETSARSLGATRIVDGLPTEEVSTQGDAVLEVVQTPKPSVDEQAWKRHQTLRTEDPTDAASIRLTARILEDSSSIDFVFTPGIRASAKIRTGAKPSSLGAAANASLASVPGTSEPDATCAVPRNDPKSQVYQPTPRQVEWAADQAVVNNLKTPRPANWKGSGLASWSPQGLFPSKALAGGGRVPVQVLLGILAQESNLWQASGTALSGGAANPLVGNFYGRDVYDDDETNDWVINFADADCGYGVGQVTDGMRKAGRERPGETALPASQQRAIALDYATNISRALQILQEKWNQTYQAGVIMNDGDPAWLENWTFAVWAYNSGFHPKGTTGTPWGVGWFNNPANPVYPPNRYMFNKYGTDPSHPQDWPYQEKVLGWAAYSIATPDGPGFRTAWWIDESSRDHAQAPETLFCTANNDCEWGEEYEPDAPDVVGAPAGPCAHKNALGQYDLKCWFHTPAEYRDCGAGYCGHELLRFNSTYPEQPDGTHNPPVCTTGGLPSGSLIVDDVPASAPSIRGDCGHPWTEAGTFDLTFADPAARIDFHQGGVGFGGHMWFAHTRTATDNGGKLAVSGRWMFTNPLTKWARVMVHIPDVGAHTQQAAYKVYLGDGTVKTRYVLQRARENKWVSLGVFKFNGTPKITLHSSTKDGWGDDDIAYDAVAIKPLSAKPTNFVVALGDSYSSGEGASAAEGADYYEETDVYGELDDHLGRNACHRSRLAWSRKAVLKDYTTASIGQRADMWQSNMDYQFHACSGAQSENILPYHTVPAGQPKPTNAFGQEGTGQYGEMSQIDKGYLDENTTLVTMSIGGNDARFSDVVKECIYASGIFECPDSELAGESDDMSVQVPRDINGRVKQSIRTTVQEIAKRAPNAKIILMGYPKLLEQNGDCITGISDREGIWINDMGGVMSSMLTDLVDNDETGLRASGVKVWYSDPVAAFAGKAICGAPERIHGIVMDKTESDKPGPGPSNQSFHPKADGTDNYQSSLQATLRLLGLAV